jgi:hypothetical protein
VIAIRKLVVWLAVVAVLLTGADRAALAFAESKISDRVAASYQLPARPGVSIRGFPFLTQVLAGYYREVDLAIPRVPVGSITLVRLHARLLGVHAPLSGLLRGGVSTVTAGRAAGSAVIPYPELAGWLPHGVTLSGAGRDVRVSGSMRVLGMRVPLSGTAAPSVTSAGIRVAPERLNIPGGVSVPAGAVAGRLGVIIPLTDLPLHLRVGSVSVTGAGLRAGASARDVQFSGGL